VAPEKPKDPEILQQMLVDLTTQLDKTQRLLRRLREAKSGTRGEQLSADQLRLFRRALHRGFPRDAFLRWSSAAPGPPCSPGGGDVRQLSQAEACDAD
jgi:hypothetical protein